MGARGMIYTHRLSIRTMTEVTSTLSRTLIILIAVCVLLAACDRTSAIEKHATDAILSDNWDDAIKYANDWITIDPGAPVPHYILNVSYTARENRDLAIKERDSAFGSDQNLKVLNDWTEELARAYPRSPRAVWLRGIVLEDSNKIEGAIWSYQTSIELDKTFIPGYESLGHLYLASLSG
jgi:hypothetical protein